MTYIVSEVIGFTGLFFLLLSFQKKERNTLLCLQILSSIFYMVHYFIIDAYTASIINILGILRGIVFYNNKKEWASKKCWLYIFLVLVIISGIVTYQKIYSILPMIAVITGTLALWSDKSKKIRIVFLANKPLWFVYNYNVGSIPGMATDILVFLSIIIGMLKHDINLKEIVKKVRLFRYCRRWFYYFFIRGGI